MYKRVFCSFILSLFIFSITCAQPELYIQKEIRAAYVKNTRSEDGRPGTAYWQNHSSYNIKASIDPSSKTLNGEETILYKNNSPDTLKRIVLKLYQNLYKKGAARNIALSDDALTDGMNVTRLSVNNSEYSLDPADRMISIQGTNLIVTLSQPLSPKSELEIMADWNFVIPPSESPRMGIVDSLVFPGILVPEDCCIR